MSDASQRPKASTARRSRRRSCTNPCTASSTHMLHSRWVPNGPRAVRTRRGPIERARDASTFRSAAASDPCDPSSIPHTPYLSFRALAWLGFCVRQKATWDFWRGQLSEAEQTAWKGFLDSFGYNPANDELCVNELLAYFTTERELLQWRGNARGKGGTEEHELQRMQRRFNAFIKDYIPKPKPDLPGQFCGFR